MGPIFKFFEIPRFWKRIVTLLADISFVSISFLGAFYLRVGMERTLRLLTEENWYVLLITCIISLAVWVKLGLYRAVIRYMDIKALSNIALGGLISATSLLVAAYLIGTEIPRSVPFIYLAIILIFTAGSRLLIRGLINSRDNGVKEKVIIYGAGASGRQLGLALINGKEYTPLAFVDRDPHIQNTTVSNVRVYPPEKLEKLISENNIQKVLLAIPSATSQQKKTIIRSLESLKVRILTIPGSADLVSGKVSVSVLRDVEIKDLLGRESVPPKAGLLEKCISEKVVMVTGGGGSIGSELCRQIAKLAPTKLIIFESSEYNLYSIEQELREKAPDVAVYPILGSILNVEHVSEVIKSFSVHTIYHAAAYKHVPLVEMNTGQGLLNNIMGTKNVAEAAMLQGVEYFVLISTDKAVRPTNVMGASKRLAELVVQNLAARSENTVFCMVRFGNVLGSSGSVVPRFKAQIEQGGPVTVTHPEITRYFMTIPEAASLVIQAGAMANGGEVFVLDMGKPVKIRDLAENMIKLMGLGVKSDSNPDGDIEIQYSGLRPGEKLYEELLIGNKVEGTGHSRIMKAREISLDSETLNSVIEDMHDALRLKDMARIREILMSSKLGFSPVSDVADILYTQVGTYTEVVSGDNIHVLKQ